MKSTIIFSAILLASMSFNGYTQDTTKTKAEFKPSGKLWGLVFSDYYFKVHADSLGRGTGEYSNIKENANTFEFRRIYLGYDYQISEKFSAELLLAHEKNYDANSNRTVFIKSANVKWKNILPKNDLIIGQSATPTWSFISEKVWGYRSVEKTVTDFHKAGNSNDVGIALQGKIDSAGNFGYNLMVGNGTGSKAETDISKKMYGDIYIKLFNKKLIVDLYADYERTQLSPYEKSKTTFKFFVGYQTEKFTTGIELFHQLHANYALYFNDSTYLSASISDIGISGISIFAKGTLLKDKLGFFIRGDVFDPDVNFNKEYVYQGGYSAYNTEMFSVVGLDYTPVKNVHIMPNVWYSGYASRKKNAKGFEKADYDLVPRLTVHYIFK